MVSCVCRIKCIFMIMGLLIYATYRKICIGFSHLRDLQKDIYSWLWVFSFTRPTDRYILDFLIYATYRKIYIHESGFSHLCDLHKDIYSWIYAIDLHTCPGNVDIVTQTLPFATLVGTPGERIEFAFVMPVQGYVHHIPVREEDVLRACITGRSSRAAMAG